MNLQVRNGPAPASPKAQSSSSALAAVFLQVLPSLSFLLQKSEIRSQKSEVRSQRVSCGLVDQAFCFRFIGHTTQHSAPELKSK